MLFLKKHKAKTTEQIRKWKIELQDNIIEKNDYLKQLQEIDEEKKQHINDLKGIDNSEGWEGKALSQSESYKAWRGQVNAEHKEKVDALREILSQEYAEQKLKALDDYPIFMAIAEDIGYDATGKPTNNNELDVIGKELTRFIETIETGEI